MKTLKYLFAFMLPLFAMATISSCSEDEASYSPAAIPAGAEVFFDASNAQSLSLEQEAATFEVLVTRLDTTEAISVPLSLKCDSLEDCFALVNETVEFAQGVAQTVVKVSYDGAAAFEALGYANFVDVVIAIEDEKNASEYGISKYVVSVGFPEPWSEWEEFGTGTYFYVNFLNGEDTERPVLYREYMLNDVDAQFMVKEVFYGVDLIIDYDRQTGNCQVKPQYVGYDNSSGPIYVTDMPNFMDGLTYDKYPCTFDETSGTFSLTTIYSTMENIEGNTGSYWGKYGAEIIQLDGYYIPDYTANVEYTGVFTNVQGAASAVVTVTLGADVESCRVAMFDNNDAANIEAVKAGEVEYQTLKESGFVSFPVDGTGNYTFVVVSYVGEDVMSESSSTFEVVVGERPEEDEFEGAPIEDYVGEWSFVSTWPGEEPYEWTGKIEQTEVEGQPALLCTGFAGPLAEQLGYTDDAFIMLYDAESGLVTLPAQDLAALNYQGTDYDMMLQLANAAEMQVFGGSLIGGFKGDKFVFVNAETNEYTADSWIFNAPDLGGVSNFNALEMTRVGGGNDNGEEVEIDGAEIEAYEGDWSFSSSFPGKDTYEWTGNIQQVEIEGETYLLCTGFGGPTAEQLGYDDSFLMIYDAETGLIGLPSQDMADLEYQGATYPCALYTGISETKQVFPGKLVGGFNDGKIVFVNDEANENVADSYVIFAVMNNQPTLISYFNSLVLSPEAAEAPAKVSAFSVAERGVNILSASKAKATFKGGLKVVKKPIKVNNNELKQF